MGSAHLGGMGVGQFVLAPVANGQNRHGSFETFGLCDHFGPPTCCCQYGSPFTWLVVILCLFGLGLDSAPSLSSSLSHSDDGGFKKFLPFWRPRFGLKPAQQGLGSDLPSLSMQAGRSWGRSCFLFGGWVISGYSLLFMALHRIGESNAKTVSSFSFYPKVWFLPNHQSLRRELRQG